MAECCFFVEVRSSLDAVEQHAEEAVVEVALCCAVAVAEGSAAVVVAPCARSYGAMRGSSCSQRLRVDGSLLGVY